MKSPDSVYYVEVQNTHGRVKGHVKVDEVIYTLTAYGFIRKLVSMRYIPACPKYI